MVGLDEWTQVLAALSLATDLANGHEDERTLRSCVLAVGLAEAVGLDAAACRDVFHTTLLRFIGCSSFAHEEAQRFGDDLVARRAFAEVDYGDTSMLWRAGDQAFAAEPRRLARLVKRSVAVLGAKAGLRQLYAAQCEVGRRFGVRLAVGDGVVTASARSTSAGTGAAVRSACARSSSGRWCGWCRSPTSSSSCTGAPAGTPRSRSSRAAAVTPSIRRRAPPSRPRPRIC